METKRNSNHRNYSAQLEQAKSYSEIWGVVKDTAYEVLGLRRKGLMLFLDDLPIQLGAYHPIGTNNIVLNRTLVEIAENALSSKRVVNAFVYIILLHEYVHALGEYSEVEDRKVVLQVAQICFGGEHVVTDIAKKSPWSVLRGIPLEVMKAPKRVMEIVKDFEPTDKYIV